jgi:hypothetical protein
MYGEQSLSKLISEVNLQPKTIGRRAPSRAREGGALYFSNLLYNEATLKLEHLN